MKIIDIRTIQLSYRAANPSMSAASFNAARNALIVEVETDAGLTGIAEAGSAGGPPASTAAVIEHELKPLLIGQDPLKRGRGARSERAVQAGDHIVFPMVTARFAAQSGSDDSMWAER